MLNRSITLPCGKQGCIFVLSAPAGTGKTTLADRLVSSFLNLKRAVTVTTRFPRKGEVDGDAYHFVDEQTFLQQMREGFFLEHVLQYGNRYGTDKKDVEQLLASGNHLLLVVDTDGAKAISRIYPQAVLIFIKPPSREELEKRLSKRGSENEHSLQLRLEKATKELQDESFFKYSVVNDDLERALNVLLSIVIAECYINNK